MAHIIGITGGIASGKSTVTAYLRQEGYQVVDADALVHDLQAPGGRLYQVLLEHFGPEVLLEDGKLNRPRLASLIFSDPQEGEWSKRTQGAIIREELERLKEQLARTETVFFMDIPLLFEQGYAGWFDEVWLVFAPREIQLKRLMQRDNLSLEEAKLRLDAQWSLEDKKALASHVLENSGGLDQLKEQVQDLLEGGGTHSGR